MKSPLLEEVEQALTQKEQHIDFETPPEVAASPLNQTVHSHSQQSKEDWNVWKPQTRTKNTETLNEQTPVTPEFATESPPWDAPPQEIDTAADASKKEPLSDTEPPLSKTAAKQTAETILGMSNNILGVGGRYLVTLKKDESFYAYQEVLEMIDEQNDKNVEKVKLDKEDKALLKPLIVDVLQEKAKKLTPQQQLMGAVLSIVAKKAQVLLQIKAENKILLESIREIVLEQKKAAEETKQTPETIFPEEQAATAYEQEEIPLETQDIPEPPYMDAELINMEPYD